jgi:hypothetical protein
MLLQPCSTHGNKFKTKFNLEKNKMAMSKKKTFPWFFSIAGMLQHNNK